MPSPAASSTDVETIDASPGRRRVLDAAAERFVAHGYAGTTLRQIAASAGIKAGSIYHHFDSKEALFVAVLDDGIAVMTQAFDNVACAQAGAPRSKAARAARLRDHVRAHLGAVFEHGPYTTAHVTAFFSAPEAVREQVVPRRDSYENQWNDLLGLLFPTIDGKARRLHRLILFGAMNATVEWFDPDRSTSLDELAATITNQFLHGIDS